MHREFGEARNTLSGLRKEMPSVLFTAMSQHLTLRAMLQVAHILHGLGVMEVKVVVALDSAMFEFFCREAYWIAFVSFLFMRPVLHVMPVVRSGNAPFNLAVGASITMIAVATMLALPLLLFGYIPMPRSSEFRQAYSYGLISGGLMTHGLWLLLIKLSILKAHAKS